MKLLVVTIVLGVLYKELTAVLGDIGTAASYGPPYIPTKCYGRSKEQFPPANMFVAVSDGLWDNGAACGRKYRLKCLSGNNKPCKDQTIDVQVVDACLKNPCQSNLVLSKDAFAAISRIPDAKINIEYIQI
ncbi:hypothetical protein AAC387_Pa02g0704 [Persea americana]